MNAAIARESMGKLYEKWGRFIEAKAVRLKGADMDQMICANPNVSLKKKKKKNPI